MNKELFIKTEIEKTNNDNVLTLLKLINENKRVIFTKFGDGEYFNMTSYLIQKDKMTSPYFENCDKDKFTYDFGILLRKAFIDLCKRSTKDNIFLGRWHNNDVNIYLLELLFENSDKYNLVSPPFVNYHYIYPDYEYHKNNNLFNFVKTIQNINNFKLIISNKNNNRLNIIFKGNYYLEIPENSWFAMGLYNQIKDFISKVLNDFNNAFIILAAGMGSKILINELSSLYHNASFLDIGSGFDILASKKDTRNWNQGNSSKNNYTLYENQVNYFKELLPEDF
jgi:hypothetical protein